MIGPSPLLSGDAVDPATELDVEIRPEPSGDERMAIESAFRIRSEQAVRRQAHAHWRLRREDR